MDFQCTHFVIIKRPNKPLFVQPYQVTVYKQYDGYYCQRNKVLLDIPNITINKDYSLSIDLYTNDDTIINNLHTFIKQHILNITNSITKEL